MEQNLDSMRKIINGVDKKLVALFEERMETVTEIAQYKRLNQLKVLDAGREKEVIERAVSGLKNQNLEMYLRFFMDDLMTLCRQYQIDQMKEENLFIPEERENEIEPGAVIGHYGSAGSFSEEAAISHFGEDYSRKAYMNFEEVISALLAEEINIGILPVENSSTGTITAVMDLIRDHHVYITGEHIVRIRQQLLAVPGAKLSDIRIVYSHHQGFEQSSQFLKQYPWEQIVYKSTASSAELVRDLADKSKAAIASSRCAQLYGLDILSSNIHYNQKNYTRFIMVGRELVMNRSCDKISIAMGIPHKPGALYNILRLFNERNLNLMKIESRPMIGKPWEYLFFFDFEGSLLDDRVQNLLECLKDMTHDFRVLGNYRSMQGNV